MTIDVGDKVPNFSATTDGVWQEKKNYGKTYMGIVRSTFLIDEKGKIAAVWRNLRVKGHVEKVLEEAQKL